MLSFNLLIKTLCILVLIPFFISNIRKKYSFLQHAVFFIFYAYVCLVVKVTFFPIPFDIDFLKRFVDMSSVRYNLIPLKFLIDSIHADEPVRIALISEAAKNVLIFLPMGFLLPLVSRKELRFWQILLSGMIISFSVELIQLLLDVMLFVAYRVVDINDIIMNTIGTLIGFLMFLGLNWIVMRILKVPIRHSLSGR